jgi:hypothetical protein
VGDGQRLQRRATDGRCEAEAARCVFDTAAGGARQVRRRLRRRGVVGQHEAEAAQRGACPTQQRATESNSSRSLAATLCRRCHVNIHELLACEAMNNGLA